MSYVTVARDTHVKVTDWDNMTQTSIPTCGYRLSTKIHYSALKILSLQVKTQVYWNIITLAMSTEAAVSYAALILADAELEITSDNLLAVTKAAGANVENIWADVYAKALEGKDLKELLFSFAAAAPAAAPAGGDAAAAGETEAAKEEAPAEEESDEDLGMGLFD